jgi:biotin transporter BioY
MAYAATAPARAGRAPAVLADLVPSLWVRELVLVLAAAGLTGAAAQLSVHIPGTPVPVTGETFAALLAGAALGTRRGVVSMALFLVAGGLGVPWFTGHQSGFGLPTLGYVIGFVPAAALVGALAERRGDRGPLRTVATMLLGTIVIYAVGWPYLAHSLHVSMSTAFHLGVRPFLVGDALKVALAAGLLPAAWLGVRRVRGDDA